MEKFHRNFFFVSLWSFGLLLAFSSIIILTKNIPSTKNGLSKRNACIEVAPKQYQFTACVITRNSAAYFTEWIEFHRLQGVDHFVIYDDRSEDGVRMFQNIYSQAGYPDLVHTFSAVFDISDTLLTEETPEMYSQRRTKAFTHCYNMYGNRTGWFMFIDDDQFVHSLEYPSIITQLKQDKWSKASIITVPEILYGTNGTFRPFDVYVSLNKDNGGFEIRYLGAENHYPLPDSFANKTDVFPLIMEANPNRMPSKELDNNLIIPEDCYDDENKLRSICEPGNGVTIMRALTCSESNLAKCRMDENDAVVKASLKNEMRVNRYFLRSVKDRVRSFAEGGRQEILEHLDLTYFSQIPDLSLRNKYSELLRSRIEKLNLQILF